MKMGACWHSRVEDSKIHSVEMPPEITKAIAALSGPVWEGSSKRGCLTI
jgi:hypothetical protein